MGANTLLLSGLLQGRSLIWNPTGQFGIIPGVCLAGAGNYTGHASWKRGSRASLLYAAFRLQPLSCLLMIIHVGVKYQSSGSFCNALPTHLRGHSTLKTDNPTKLAQFLDFDNRRLTFAPSNIHCMHRHQPVCLFIRSFEVLFRSNASPPSSWIPMVVTHALTSHIHTRTRTC